MTVGYSSGEAEKERRPQQKQVTFIQARRGDSQPNDQNAERVQGGFILIGRFVDAIRDTLIRRDIVCVCVVYYLIDFFSFIFISWRLITSQHCSGFCHTLT